MTKGPKTDSNENKSNTNPKAQSDIETQSDTDSTCSIEENEFLDIYEIKFLSVRKEGEKYIVGSAYFDGGRYRFKHSYGCKISTHNFEVNQYSWHEAIADFYQAIIISLQNQNLVSSFNSNVEELKNLSETVSQMHLVDDTFLKQQPKENHRLLETYKSGAIFHFSRGFVVAWEKLSDDQKRKVNKEIKKVIDADKLSEESKNTDNWDELNITLQKQ